MTHLHTLPGLAAAEKQAFFRQLLRADGIFSILSGALSMLMSGVVADLFGLADASPILLIMGFLFLYGCSMFYFSRLPLIPRWYAWLSTEIDFAWVIGSLLLIVTGAFSINTTGKIVIFVAALAVSVVTALKYWGLRQMAS